MASDGDRSIALLRYANYAKVAEALHVSRASVADWAKGRSVTPYRLRQLEQLLRPDLQIEEAPPPEWARAMERRLIAELRLNRALIEDEPDEVALMRAEIDELRRDGLPRDGSPPVAGPGRPGSAGGTRR